MYKRKYHGTSFTRPGPWQGIRNKVFTALSVVTRLDFAVAGVAITDITKEVPCEVMATGHGLINGDRVFINGVLGMTQVNNKEYFITKIDDDTFTLDGIDSSAYTDYTSAGTVYKIDSEDDSQCNKVLLQNLGTDIIYIGPADTVTTSNGIALKPDGVYEEYIDDLNRLWIISDGSGATDIRVQILKPLD